MDTNSSEPKIGAADNLPSPPSWSCSCHVPWVHRLWVVLVSLRCSTKPQTQSARWPSRWMSRTLWVAVPLRCPGKSWYFWDGFPFNWKNKQQKQPLKKSCSLHFVKHFQPSSGLVCFQWFEEKLQEVECEEQRLRKLHAVVETLVNHRKGNRWLGNPLDWGQQCL